MVSMIAFPPPLFSYVTQPRVVDLRGIEPLLADVHTGLNAFQETAEVGPCLVIAWTPGESNPRASSQPFCSVDFSLCCGP